MGIFGGLGFVEGVGGGVVALAGVGVVNGGFAVIGGFPEELMGVVAGGEVVEVAGFSETEGDVVGAEEDAVLILREEVAQGLKGLFCDGSDHPAGGGGVEVVVGEFPVEAFGEGRGGILEGACTMWA